MKNPDDGRDGTHGSGGTSGGGAPPVTPPGTSAPAAPPVAVTPDTAAAAREQEPTQWQSLYRRYRPQRFGEVRGQDHVTLALRHAVRDDKVAHAYLFSGPRGTGKTSTARILAKALNCTSPVDGEPCGLCDSCVAITRGSSFDVHELDAASNNGVDAMRDLVARASLATPGRWKVYIVDEVHMLSTAASNALLKTLEEPPSHVVFVLATTDPQKVLPTIRSRTQHFEFHLLGAETLISLLGDIASDANLDLPEDGLEVAVRRGKGSARDALSVLDQVVAAGVTDDELPVLSELVAALAERDTAKALGAVAAALDGGRDPHRLAVDLVEELRRGFLLIAAPQVAARLDTALGPADAAAEQIRQLGLARCVRAMETIGATQVDMKSAADPRITLEVALARLTHPETDDSPAALLERIERLERALRAGQEGGGSLAASPGATPGPAPAAPARSAGPAPAGSARSAPAGSTGPSSTDPAAVRRERPVLGEDPPQQARIPQEERPAERPALGAFKRPGPSTPSGIIAPAERPRPSGATVDQRDATRQAPPGGGGKPAGEVPAPSRDELVEAWGDHVLTALRARPRAIFQAGRFVAAEGAVAVFALPNKFHLEHAEEMRGEVADALSRHFGRPIKLTLVVDEQHAEAGGARPDAGPGSGATQVPSALPDPEEYEAVGEVVVEDTGVSWATERLLQAFPGAEEV